MARKRNTRSKNKTRTSRRLRYNYRPKPIKRRAWSNRRAESVAPLGGQYARGDIQPPSRGRSGVGGRNSTKNKSFSKTAVVHTTEPTEKRRATICRKRQQRREIMHAIKRAGQSGQKKPEYKNRNIKC